MWRRVTYVALCDVCGAVTGVPRSYPAHHSRHHPGRDERRQPDQPHHVHTTDEADPRLTGHVGKRQRDGSDELHAG